ncbi:hypothetical protein PhaeoP54_01917 [Phaeobacter inhibens]|nr:hypothetical protein PhaeoP54_01917 [Phaeobacter inhibens]
MQLVSVTDDAAKLVELAIPLLYCQSDDHGEATGAELAACAV